MPKNISAAFAGTVDDHVTSYENGFTSTDTSRRTSTLNAFGRSDFFSFRDVVNKQAKQQQKAAPPMRRFYCSFLFRFFLLYFLLYSYLIEILRACRTTSIEARVSSPHAPPRRGAQQRGRISSEPDPGPRSRDTGPSPSRVASELMNVRSCRTLDSRRINF